jgi:hypothetical protein
MILITTKDKYALIPESSVWWGRNKYFGSTLDWLSERYSFPKETFTLWENGIAIGGRIYHD